MTAQCIKSQLKNHPEANNTIPIETHNILPASTIF